MRVRRKDTIDENPIRTLGATPDLATKDLLQKVPHHGIDLWLQFQIFYDHVNPVIRQTIDQAAGGKLHDKNTKESWELLEDLSLYDNESCNDPRDFAKPVKAISFPQDVPSTSDRRLIELENQVQRLMESHLAPKSSVQEGRLFSLRSQLKQQQDDVINKINTLWKAVSEKFDNTPAHDTAGNFMALVNAISINHLKEGAPLSKGIKSSSKLLSLKYLSQSSLEEQNRNPSSPKCVQFINSIVILRKEDGSREAGTIGSDAAKDISHNIIIGVEKKAEEGLDSSKIVIGEDEPRDIKQNKLDDRTCGETEVDEVEMKSEESEEEEDDPKYFDTFPTIEE
ncbi:hypothetical protein Tco_1123296 [Tanacetum coccineum]|uniref:Uncharacterized protein n=1 Tax=Tanacetum coccineum TaxID=301880 RepID=A0ABQ5J2Z0_9ASTR